mmetsp:Transcript_12488/g.24888  ORF Transcript_12488/g.24888 Transcript_12488/m.24888 type:complete len:105 (-) Transcript_12488:251-565(-)
MWEGKRGVHERACEGGKEAHEKGTRTAAPPRKIMTADRREEAPKDRVSGKERRMVGRVGVSAWGRAPPGRRLAERGGAAEELPPSPIHPPHHCLCVQKNNAFPG